MILIQSYLNLTHAIILKGQLVENVPNLLSIAIG